jgi:DNA-binding SARP family transcriptional activator
MHMNGQLAAHLFGAFRLTIDAVLVDTTSSRRTRNLLAYLILHRRTPVPRDVLMEVFWPKAPVAAARNRLNVALSGVRQTLRTVSSHPVIERRSDAYQISDAFAVWVDVEHFEQACAAGRQADLAEDRAGAAVHYQHACDLYQGELLADEPYAAWTSEPRDALALQAIDAMRRLMEIYVDRGWYGPAALIGRHVVALDPCHEDVHRHLMTCYAAAGQRHLALAQYRHLAAVLRETFGVSPSAETASLYESLRRSA